MKWAKWLQVNEYFVLFKFEVSKTRSILLKIEKNWTTVNAMEVTDVSHRNLFAVRRCYSYGYGALK